MDVRDDLRLGEDGAAAAHLGAFLGGQGQLAHLLQGHLEHSSHQLQEAARARRALVVGREGGRPSVGGDAHGPTALGPQVEDGARLWEQLMGAARLTHHLGALS